MAPPRAGTSPAPTTSRLQVVHGPRTGGDKPRPYNVPSRSRAWPQDGRGQAPPLQRPVSKSCMAPGRAGTSPAPTTSRLEVVHGPRTGGDKPRPYNVPSRNRAWPQDGRGQAPPLQRPVSKSCMAPGRAGTSPAPTTSRLEIVHGPRTGGDKPRSYNVPSRNRARPQDGRGQAPPLQRPVSKSCMAPGRAGTSPAPTTSRLEVVHGPRTGGDKLRPYNVPSRSRAWPKDGRGQAPPLQRPVSKSCMAQGRAGTSPAPTTSRLGVVHGPTTGGDKLRPYTTGSMGVGISHSSSMASAAIRQRSSRYSSA